MNSWLRPSQICGIFTDEVAPRRGSVLNTFEDEGHLFAHSVLPPLTEVGPGDKLQGGVALRATDSEIFIHPYVFRLVCTNGAIMARATQTRQISLDNWFVDAADDLEGTVRCAIRGCCTREAFVVAVDQMRFARHAAADMAITIAAFMTGHRASLPASMMAEILRRYDREADASAYGLMNAVTSVARDTRDPEMKWRLEALGGGVPALPRPRVARRAGTPTTAVLV